MRASLEELLRRSESSTSGTPGSISSNTVGTLDRFASSIVFKCPRSGFQFGYRVASVINCLASLCREGRRLCWSASAPPFSSRLPSSLSRSVSPLSSTKASSFSSPLAQFGLGLGFPISPPRSRPLRLTFSAPSRRVPAASLSFTRPFVVLLP